MYFVIPLTTTFKILFSTVNIEAFYNIVLNFYNLNNYIVTYYMKIIQNMHRFYI